MRLSPQMAPGSFHPSSTLEDGGNLLGRVRQLRSLIEQQPNLTEFKPLIT
ncbi:MAG TPA: hypothetical protein VK211_26315 [Kamptonema sp.]|nr:hypothetical protein [Kamptonema sp.]